MKKNFFHCSFSLFYVYFTGWPRSNLCCKCRRVLLLPCAPHGASLMCCHSHLSKTTGGPRWNNMKPDYILYTVLSQRESNRDKQWSSRVRYFHIPNDKRAALCSVTLWIYGSTYYIQYTLVTNQDRAENLREWSSWFLRNSFFSYKSVGFIWSF